jgi:hypothetical protein
MIAAPPVAAAQGAVSHHPSPSQLALAPPYQPVPSSPYAAWALIVGVLGLVCFGTGPILGILAMVLAVLGWRQVHRAGGPMRGRMTAIAGFATGLVAIVEGLPAGLELDRDRLDRQQIEVLAGELDLDDLAARQHRV